MFRLLLKVLKESLTTKSTQRNTTENFTKMGLLLFSKILSYCYSNSPVSGKSRLDNLHQMCSIRSKRISFELLKHTSPGMHDDICLTSLLKVLKESLPAKNTQRNTTENSAKMRFLQFPKIVLFCSPDFCLCVKF